MLNDIKEVRKKYGDFSDSYIVDFSYSKKYEPYSNNKGDVSLAKMSVHCFDRIKGDYALVEMLFFDIVEFRLIEKTGTLLVAPSDLFYGEKENEITFDFYPIDQFDYLEENPESPFKIRCKRIEVKEICN